MINAAGLLIYRKRAGKVEVLLAHPGGPFWAKKDSWSIIKGEQLADEDLLHTAHREFKEEMGLDLPKHELVSLGEAKASNGKVNHIWTLEADIDTSKYVCTSLVTMEWPPKSGQQLEFPENDKVNWFEISIAQTKLFKNQQIFIDRLAEHLEIDLEPAIEPEQQSLL